MTPTGPPAKLSLTARCPEDLLAMVPVTLGFVPHDSVAMLTFGAAHAFHARVDLPTGAEHLDEHLDELCATLLAPARAHGVRRVVLVLYSDDAAAAARAWSRLRARCRDDGIAVLEALRADGRRWWPLLHPDPFGAGGVPYDLSVHPFLAESVLHGRVTLGSREELAATLEPLPGRIADVAAALCCLPEPWTREAPPPVATLLREGAWIEALVARHVAERSSPTDEEVARLLRALPVVPLRDAAWSLITRDSALEHAGFWTDVVRRTPRPRVTPPAVLLAWAAWQGGHGALAWCALDVATATDPDYPLAADLATLLENAVPPTAWQERVDWRAGLSPPAA